MTVTLLIIINVKNANSYPSYKARWGSADFYIAGPSWTQFLLPDYKNGSSASKDVHVYALAFAGTRCIYPVKNGQTELS